VQIRNIFLVRLWFSAFNSKLFTFLLRMLTGWIWN